MAGWARARSYLGSYLEACLYGDGIDGRGLACVWDGSAGSGGEIAHERTKVLLLVHADTDAAREAIRMVIARYRKAFDQESVLWETSQVCAAL